MVNGLEDFVALMKTKRRMAKRLRRSATICLVAGIMQAANAAFVAPGFWWRWLAIATALFSVFAFKLCEERARVLDSIVGRMQQVVANARGR